MESWVGPVYLVIFFLLGGTSSILRTFWAGPVKKVTLYQAGTTCGASSQADLTQNLVLKTRMLRFSRHSRQKCRKRSFLRQKRAVFSTKTED